MKWIDVFKRHRKVAAVYEKNGELESLTFSLDYRRSRINWEEEGRLYLCFHPDVPRRTISPLVKALETKKPVTVFRKVSPDSWEEIGLHRVVEQMTGKDALGRDSIVFAVSPA